MVDQVGGALQGIVEDIPGVKQIEDVLSTLSKLTDVVKEISGEVHAGSGISVLTEVVKHAGDALKVLEKLTRLGWDDLSTYGVGTLFKEYLELGLGLDYDRMGHEAKRSIKTIDTMLTFGTVFPLTISAADAILSFFLGQRAPKLAESILGHLAEEMGLTWAMGMAVDRAFETAVGNHLEEAILYQKRPVTPEWQVMRAMLKQHLVDEHTLRDRVKHMGFSDEWVERIVGLADAQLPVGDIQNLYLHELITEGGIDRHLEALGFSDEDRAKLKTLYIEKAVTNAGMSLRGTMRDLFTKGLIDEAQYVATLHSTNMPTREIADDLKAIHLEQDVGRLTTPLSALKAQYQHHQLEPNQVRTHLRQLLYTDEAIDNLLKQWDEPTMPHPMAASKVLTYLYSGVITDKNDALTRLIATGLRPDDAQFLIEHPPAGNARKHVLTPALVTAAYLDGTLAQEQYRQRLAEIGLSGDVLEYTYQTGLFRKSRQKPKPGSSKVLSEGAILSAMAIGVIDPQSAQNELVALGYSDVDALILMEIKLKGANPFASGGHAAFANLESAIAYLETHGYAVHPPPDPMLTAAEQMVLMAGWSFTYQGGGIASFPGGITGGAPNPPPSIPGVSPFPIGSGIPGTTPPDTSPPGFSPFPPSGVP